MSDHDLFMQQEKVMRKALLKTPLSSRRRAEESVLFRRVSVETHSTDEVARIQLDGGLAVALTTTADPGWVAALLRALEAGR